MCSCVCVCVFVFACVCARVCARASVNPCNGIGRYEKTVAHAEAALESARESLKQKNKRRQQKVAKTVRVKRKRFWFEKFHWFLAPGGYVVVSGQSAQENELIVKR